MQKVYEMLPSLMKISKFYDRDLKSVGERKIELFFFFLHQHYMCWTVKPDVLSVLFTALYPPFGFIVVSVKTWYPEMFSKLRITLNPYCVCVVFFSPKDSPKLMTHICSYLLNVIITPLSKYFPTEDHWIIMSSFNDILFGK